MAGLERTIAQLEPEARKVKKGQQKNEAAYRVAGAIAVIYVIGRGQYPTYGNRPDGSGPSTLFCRTTDAVCAELGIIVGDVVRVCRDSLSEMSDDDFGGYLLVRCPLTRHNVEFEWHQ